MGNLWEEQTALWRNEIPWTTRIPDVWATHPPKTGERIEILLNNNKHVFASFDSKWGKNGSFFSDQGHAVSMDSIFQWRWDSIEKYRNELLMKSMNT